MLKEEIQKKGNTVVIKGIPFDFTIHDDETLQGNLVFDTNGVDEIYRYYADSWDDVLRSLLHYFELKKATSTDSHVKAVWFEKIEQRK